MFKKLRRFVFSAPYNYVAGPRDIRVGVENMALVQPQLTYGADPFRSSDMIVGTMNLREGGFAGGDPSYPFTDLRAGGVYISGVLALQSLSKIQSGGAG